VSDHPPEIPYVTIHDFRIAAHLLALLLGHVTQDGENHEAREDAGG
jgi:hypothetical protein